MDVNKINIKERNSKASVLLGLSLICFLFPVAHSTDDVLKDIEVAADVVPVVTSAPQITLAAAPTVSQNNSIRPGKTSQAALECTKTKQDSRIDFSGVTDWNLEDFMQAYAAYIETNSFGTCSPNVAIDVSGTNITIDQAKEILATCINDGRIVVLTLSNNSHIGDEVIGGINLAHVASLNLRNTGFTDAGIALLVTAIGAQGLGQLRCVDVSGTKVTQEGVNSLRQAMRDQAIKQNIVLEGKDGVIAARGGGMHLGTNHQHPPPVVQPTQFVQPAQDAGMSDEEVVVPDGLTITPGLQARIAPPAGETVVDTSAGAAVSPGLPAAATDTKDEAREILEKAGVDTSFLDKVSPGLVPQ
ncbi:MAG: hypothetical protein LBF65_01365 [Holosporales bacterium]|jgi:hypothetical protein|nr:hypothetical protein [Holosporales bacterium]